MSSATTVRCPHCNSQLRIKSRRLDGKQAKCPRCTQAILLERVQGTSDYIAVLFFQGHDERWATTIQPANRDSRLPDTVAWAPPNTVASTPANKVASTPANKVASTPANKVASTPANKVASTPANKVASTPANKVASTPANTVAATPANTVSYAPGRGDRRWRWPLTNRARGVAAGLGLLFCVLIGGYSVRGNEYRVWQTADGRRSSVKLAYVTHNDRVVRLKRQDNGREIEMPLASLSPDDRTAVKLRSALDRAIPLASPAPAATDRVERRQPRGANPTPADWPMWRGSSRDGVVSAGPSLLNAWPSGGPRILWTSDRIPGEWEGGWGSVSISEGRAYAYVNIPPNKRQPAAYSGLDIVYCLDAETGETIWKFENDGGTHTTPSNGTPCIVDGRCYASGSGGYVYCLDARTGSEIWQAQTSRPGKETSSSFAVADGVAVVLSGPVTGLDAATGEELWSHSRLKSEHSSPAIWRRDGRALAICNTGHQLTAIALNSGEIEWQTRSHGGNSTPVVSGDKLVLHGGGVLSAYQLGDAPPEEMWTVHAGCHGSTPVVHNGFVYSTAAGTALCVRLSDGQTMWREGIGNSNYSSPAIADNKLITVGKNRLLMFSADTNRLERLGEERMGLVECTSPTIVDGKLYLRLKQNVVCYDLQ